MYRQKKSRIIFDRVIGIGEENI